MCLHALPTTSKPLDAVCRSGRFAFTKAALLGLLLLPTLCLAQLSPTSKKEIEGLLNAVGTSGCDFVRGGSIYSAARAKAHLTTKYEYLHLRGLLASSEEFIEKAATRSSMSGEPYAIRCAGSSQRSDEWLRVRLKSMRQAAPARRALGPGGLALQQ